jgi:hypothetical protein
MKMLTNEAKTRWVVHVLFAIILTGWTRSAGFAQKEVEKLVPVELKNRDLGMVTEDGHPIIAGGDYKISIGGGQPDTAAPGVTGHFGVEGQIALPE